MLRRVITSRSVRSSAIHRTLRNNNYPSYLLNLMSGLATLFDRRCAVSAAC